MKRSITELNFDELQELYNKILDTLKLKYDVKSKDIHEATNISTSDLARARRAVRYNISRHKLLKLIYRIYNHEEFKESVISEFQSLNFEIDNFEERFFIYYYLDKKYEIDLAILKVSYRDWKIELQFFSKESIPTKKNNQYNGNRQQYKRVPRTKYLGQVIKPEGGELFLQFNKRINDGKEAIIPSLNCFHGKSRGFDNDLMIGVFLGTESSCGLAAIQKVESEEKALEIVKNQAINPLVYSVLYKKRISPEIDLLDLKNDETNSLLTFLEEKNIHGVYEGYVLESKENREYIHKIICEIKRNGEFNFFSQETKDNNGFIVEKFYDTLIVKFHYNNTKGHHRMQIILDTLDFVTRRKDYLIGVYSGIENDNKPMAGRMLLYKKDKKYSELKPERYYLNKKPIQKLFEKIPNIKKFLRGELDTYVDAPIILEKHHLLLANEKFERNDEIKFFKGVYILYQIATQEDKVIGCPLEINHNGIVKIKTGQHTICKGQAKFHEGLLSIQINKRVKEELISKNFGHHLFFVGQADNQEPHQYHGVSSSYSIDYAPQAGRVVLIAQDRKFDNLDVQQIPIPLLGKESDMFNDLEQKHPNLGWFLTGNANNLIKTTRKVDAPFERNQDYGLLYFSSACYHAERSNTKEALKQMERAFMHGFRDKVLLKKELEKSLNIEGIKEKIDIDNLNLLH